MTHGRCTFATPTAPDSWIAPRETSSATHNVRTFAPQNQLLSFCHIFPFLPLRRKRNAKRRKFASNYPTNRLKTIQKPPNVPQSPQNCKNPPQNRPSSRPSRSKTAPSPPKAPPKAPPNCFPIPFFEATSTKIQPKFAKKRAKSAFLPPRPLLFHVKHGFSAILRLFRPF